MWVCRCLEERRAQQAQGHVWRPAVMERDVWTLNTYQRLQGQVHPYALNEWLNGQKSLDVEYFMWVHLTRSIYVLCCDTEELTSLELCIWISLSKKCTEIALRVGLHPQLRPRLFSGVYRDAVSVTVWRNEVNGPDLNNFKAYTLVELCSVSSMVSQNNRLVLYCWQPSSEC